MAYTQTDLDNVERAIVDLATSKMAVKFVVDGDVVEYSRITMPELKSLRNDIITELSAADQSSITIHSFSISG